MATTSHTLPIGSVVREWAVTWTNAMGNRAERRFVLGADARRHAAELASYYRSLYRDADVEVAAVFG